MTTTDNGQHFATRTKVAKKPLSFFREAGRGKALVQINNVVKFHPGVIALMGEEGSGRSRVLKQVADSLKNKPGQICILDRALKNEEQLYAAIADGFAMDHVPGENLKAIQKTVFSFLEANTESNKPIIIALDSSQRCSLAVLEALLALRAKYKAMSLILAGDNGLQKMLQRLHGGNLAVTPVQLAPLNTREVRQYMNWRVSFQLSEAELADIVNAASGNIALLEQEALKAEHNYRQKNAQQSGAAWWGAVSFSRVSLASVLIVVVVAGGAAAIYYLPPARFEAMTEIVTKAQPLLTNWLDRIPGMGKELVATVQAPQGAQNSALTLRSNQEWTERQITFLMADANQSM